MAKKEKRFVKTYSQGGWDRSMEIWVDRQTGVNYVCTQNGYAGGMTPLLNRDGTPVITSVPTEFDK
ncbi:MAG: xylan 1,4-beta-xylosidase [Ruminococcaceae bacterium]|nr:xylan 1,4-beta-xylosidase [Oscillospiraceae bacterium]